MASPQSPPFDFDILMRMLAANPPRSAHQMRQMIDGLAGMLNQDLPEVGRIYEKVLVTEDDEGAVTADVVVPKGAGPHPMLVYLHGGGWISGSPLTHRKLAFRFAEAGYLVFNVDYRLAPEHPFPRPLEDCVHAVRWAAREGARYGGDATRLAVGGDSAGANLTAATAVALADDASAPRIGACLLIYGAFDLAWLNGVDLGEPLSELGRDMTEIMLGAYLGSPRGEGLLGDPRVSPIHAASKLPPSHVVVGTLDPLLRDSRVLAEALRKADVAHEHVEVEGMPHAFVQMEFLPQARQSIDRMVGFLGTHLGG